MTLTALLWQLALVLGMQSPVWQAAPAETAKPKTVVKDEFAKTPRNAPCPCGSGKKFKMCHGAA